MKPLRDIITMVCIVATFIATAGEQLTVTAKGAVNQPAAVQPQRLEGTWEGFMVGAEADGKITITITGNSLHFRRDKHFWFETTFTLPAGTDPKQLRATIKDCADKKSIGEVVPAIYKIEDGTLTLAGEPRDGSKAFEEPSLFRYKLHKVAVSKEEYRSIHIQMNRKRHDGARLSQPKPPNAQDSIQPSLNAIGG